MMHCLLCGVCDSVVCQEFCQVLKVRRYIFDFEAIRLNESLCSRVVLCTYFDVFCPIAGG